MTSGDSKQQFQELHWEFTQILDHVKQKIRILPDQAGERRKIVIEEAERELEEATKFLRKMEAVAKESTQRTLFQTQIRTLEADLSRVRRELLLTIPNTSGIYARSELETDQRNKLLDGHERLMQTSNRLDNIQRVSEDTEAVGTSALGSMYHQREQLEHANEMVGQVDDKLDTAKHILRSMWFRAITDIFIQLIIVILLVLTIIAVIFFKWIMPVFT